MKFLALLTLSLIGTSVAAPLNRRATNSKAVAAKATPSTAGYVDFSFIFPVP